MKISDRYRNPPNYIFEGITSVLAGVGWATGVHPYVGFVFEVAVFVWASVGTAFYLDSFYRYDGCCLAVEELKGGS